MLNNNAASVFITFQGVVQSSNRDKAELRTIYETAQTHHFQAS